MSQSATYLASDESLYAFFIEGSHGRPTWNYPELRDTGTNENLSLVSYDLLVTIGIVLVTVVSLGIKFGFKSNAMLGNLKARLDSVNKDTSMEPIMRGPLREVSHVRKESFFLWFSVMNAVAFLTFKILSGSREADAGQIFLLILVALFAKMLRQETWNAEPSKVLMALFPTGFAIVATYLGYVGYSKSQDYYQRDKINGWYVAGMIFGVVAMVVKTLQTIFEDGLSVKKMKDEKNNSKMAGEYMYPLRLMDVIVFSLVSIFFFTFQSIVVARADVKLYAVAFWALWILPIYCIVMQIVQSVMYKTGALASVFNVVLALHALAIVLLAQLQVCSIYRVDDQDSLFTQLTTDAAVSRGPSMCPGRWGLFMHEDTDDIKMHKGAVWVLAIITSLFFTASYAGATFTLYQADERVERNADNRV